MLYSQPSKWETALVHEFQWCEGSQPGLFHTTNVMATDLNQCQDASQVPAPASHHTCCRLCQASGKTLSQTHIITTVRAVQTQALGS